MDLYEAIFVRKSVRNFSPEPLSEATLDRLRKQYRELEGLFGNVETDISILDNRRHQQRRLSMLSVNAPYYMAFYSENVPRFQMNIGYLMEQMVLYMCSIGIGTCILGTTMVRKELQLKDGKQIVGIIAFGKAKGSPIRRQSEARRLSMDELCVFKEVPRQWMKQLLEAARLSPSAMNSQPWRFVVYDHKIHIFSKKRKTDKLHRLDEISFGVMFANLMVAAEELWLDVDLIRLEDISQKNFPNSQYVLSAVLKA